MIHLKYPSMERQDLSQAQLGSFKFTPVDEVNHYIFQSQSHSLLNDECPSSLDHHRLIDPQPYLLHSSTPSNASFFDAHIKPDLNDFRLRLGPAAIRAAVESASSSPQKRFTEFSTSQAVLPTGPAFLHSNSIVDQNWQMMASNPSFSDNATFEHEISSSSALTTSLLRALENEQQAHEATKLSLEAELNKRTEFETEMQRLTDHNKSLLNSIRLLQSTIRHMVQNERSSEIPDSKYLDAAVREYKNKAKHTNITGSILYDPFSRSELSQRSNSTSHEQSRISSVSSESRLTNPTSSKREDANTSVKSAADVHAEEDHKSADVAKPEEQVLIRAYEPYIYESGMNNSISMSEHSSTDGSKSFDDEYLVKRMKGLQLSSEPILQLPKDFVSKYRKPVDKLELTGKSRTLQPANKNILKSMNPTLRLPTTLDIEWKVTENNPIFADNEDLSMALRGQQRQGSYFYQHPVRYVPNMGAKNIFRTVMIDYIPVDATYKDVLLCVRGGTLESIQVVPPVGRATNYKTARIVYKHETGAISIYKRGQKPGIKINGQRVRVWQVLEPTYPSNQELEDAIYEEEYTRLLVINPPNISVIDKLSKKLESQIQAGFVINIGKASDETPMVEFTSIEQALKALKLLIEDADFGGTVFDFEEDYCETPYP